MSIKGKIIKIIPVSSYQEKVYTQDAIVELNNGLKMAVSDPSKYCKKEDIGKIKDFTIKVFLASLTEKVYSCEPKIYPNYSEIEPYQGPTADICGRVDQIVDMGSNNIERSYCILNIGVGAIKIIYKDIRGLNLLDKNIDNTLKQKLSYFVEGNYIKITGATLYMDEIE